MVQLFWCQFFDYVFFPFETSNSGMETLFATLLNHQRLDDFHWFVAADLHENLWRLEIRDEMKWNEMKWDEIRWNEMKWKRKRKKKAKAASSQQPAASQQYICQYKIQNIVPNTFSNKESIAHKESLHNLLKKFIHFPSIVWGGGVTNPFPTIPF